jgi:chromate reductase, NAD(P)H dehydrogenase (quinone)
VPNPPKILAFAGSLRADSFNKKLIRIAARSAKESGAEVTLIDLKDYPLPLFDEDLETQATPENASKLKQLFREHQGVLLSCPEYNSSITGVLKNVIDWVSRTGQGETSAYSQKSCALLSASPGALGGLRGLVHVRSILGNLNVLLVPQQVALSEAHEAFTPEGELKDSKQKAAVDKVVVELVSLLKKLHPA